MFQHKIIFLKSCALSDDKPDWVRMLSLNKAFLDKDNDDNDDGSTGGDGD